MPFSPGSTTVRRRRGRSSSAKQDGSRQGYALGDRHADRLGDRQGDRHKLKRRSSDPGRVSKHKKHKDKRKGKHKKRSRSGSDSEGPVQLSRVCLWQQLGAAANRQSLMHSLCVQHLSKAKAGDGVKYSSVSGQRVRVWLSGWLQQGEHASDAARCADTNEQEDCSRQGCRRGAQQPAGSAQRHL